MLKDVFGHGNEKCMLPGTIEANSAKLSEQANGLLFTEAEVKGFIHLAGNVVSTPPPGILRNCRPSRVEGSLRSATCRRGPPWPENGHPIPFPHERVPS